MALNPG